MCSARMLPISSIPLVLQCEKNMMKILAVLEGKPRRQAPPPDGMHVLHQYDLFYSWPLDCDVAYLSASSIRRVVEHMALTCFLA